MNKTLSLVFAGALLSSASLTTLADDGYHMLGGQGQQGYVGDSPEMHAIIGSPEDDGMGVMEEDYMMFDGDGSLPSSPWDAAPVTHGQDDDMHEMTIESQEF